MRQKLIFTAFAMFFAVFGAIMFCPPNVSGQTEQTNAAKKKIGMKKAREIALAKASGKIEGSELERESGKMVYSFDIRNKKGTITEVQVEAYTGEIVSVEEENKQAEAAEKKAEKAEKSKKRKS